MAQRLPWRGGPLDDRMRDVLSGRAVPAEPRDSATVILLRPAPGEPHAPAESPGGGVEVFMLRRSRGMAFAPGAHVFPGGSVDAGDGDPAIGWAGPSAAELGELFGTSADRARALACAAVREMFEEAGVLLASAGPDGPPAPPDADWDRDRQELAAHAVTLAGVLGRRGLVLRADLLTPWARWVTPEAEPRRYDTMFFAAALPPQQRASVEDPARVGRPGEADDAAWIRPAAAIESAKAGEIRLLPPTAVTLNEFAMADDAAAILAARRRIEPLQPEIELEDGLAWITIPPGAEYPL